MSDVNKSEEVKTAEVKKVAATEVKSGKKMNTGVIVAVVVVLLLLLCGCCGAGSFFYIVPAADNVAEEFQNGVDSELTNTIIEGSEDFFFSTMIEFYTTGLEYYYDDYGYYPSSLAELDPDYLIIDQEFIETYNVVYTPDADSQSYEITADDGYSYSPAESNYPSEDVAE